MKNKRGTGLIAAGMVFILAAAGLSVYNHIEEKNAGDSSAKAAEILVQAQAQARRIKGEG